MHINQPQPIEQALLLLAHEASYVNRFLAGKLTEKEEKRIGLTPWTPAMIERTLVLMGGAVEATEYAVMHGGISGNMAGGTHHAHREFGSGYCVFNDLAVSALHALENLGLERVAIVDLDVHQGDGTATILADEPRTCTISVHCETNFPFRKSASDHDLPIPPESGDDVYPAPCAKLSRFARRTSPTSFSTRRAWTAWRRTPWANSTSQGRACGMGCLNAYGGHLVFEAAEKFDVPLVVFMGGGYAKPIDASRMDAFYDLFTDAAAWND